MSLDNAAVLYTKASELRRDGPYPYVEAAQYVQDAFNALGQNDEKNGDKAKEIRVRCYYLNALIAFDIEKHSNRKDFDNIIKDLYRCLDENGDPPLVPTVHTCTYYMLAKIAYLKRDVKEFYGNYKRAIYSARVYESGIDVPKLAPALHQQYLSMKESSDDKVDVVAPKKHTAVLKI
jgi:hypothetical protein